MLAGLVKSDFVISVKVTPRAGRNEVWVDQDGTLCIRVTAVPEDGSANRAVEEQLAKSVGVAKSRVAVVAGQKARTKKIAIGGFDTAALEHAIKNSGLRDERNR